MHEKKTVSKATKLWIVLCVCSFISSGANAMWLSIDSFVEEYLDCTVGECNISEPGMSFDFSTPDQTRFRHFSVDTDERIVIIGIPNGKGILSWDQIESITLERADKLEEGFGYVVIEFIQPYAFMTWRKYKKLGFGMMSEECWEKLKETVDGGVKVEEPR